MTTKTQRIALGLAVVCMLGNDECGGPAQEQAPAPPPPKDPFSDADLRIAQKLDLTRTNGHVTNKGTAFYVETHKDFDVKPGDRYYCLHIRQPNAVGQPQDFAYCGVSQATYDAVEIGMQLPTVRIYNVFQIAELQGRVVDKQANPSDQKWYVVVDHVSEVKVYRVDPVTYYQCLTVGQDLPFTPPRGVEARGRSAGTSNPDPPAIP